MARAVSLMRRKLLTQEKHAPMAKVQGTVNEFIEINRHSDVVRQCTHCGSELPRVYDVAGGFSRRYVRCSCQGARGVSSE